MAKVRYLGGKSADLGTLRADQNYHTYNASDDHLDGYSEVYVDVPVPTLGIKGIVSNGTYYASDDDLGGYSEVRVNVIQPPVLLDELVVTQNNTTYNASSYGVEGWNKVTSAINIPVPLLDTIEVTENGVYNAISYDLEGFDSVIVQVPAPTPIETVLWTNSTPSTGFAQQTVTLSDDFTNYTYIKFVWCYSTSNTSTYGINMYLSSEILPLGNPGQTLCMGFMRSMASNVAYTHWRGVWGIENVTNQIIIQQCNRIHSTTLDSNNNAVIPYQIIGIS